MSDTPRTDRFPCYNDAPVIKAFCSALERELNATKDNLNKALHTLASRSTPPSRGVLGIVGEGMTYRPEDNTI